MPRGDQHSRQWRLLQFLGRPAGIAVEEASQRLGCTVRTVWRDLGVLHEAGFPIYDERDGRRGLWKVDRAFFDRLPIPFSLPEVVALVFETAPPPDADALRTHEEIPRPFVIAPPPASAEQYPAGSAVAFDLTLIGRAREYLPHFVVTLREVDGMGRGRRRVALRRLDAVHPLTEACEVVYTAGESLVRPREASLTLADCATLLCPEGPVCVTFATQTRLKQDGAFARRPGFQLLFRRLLGRLSALARFHDKGPLDVDFRGLIDAAGAVRLVRDETRWTRWTRYSNRQRQRMEWEGLVGAAVFEGDLAPFWPYLAFGQWTHVGSGTTFGLGRYVIEPLAAGDRAAEARG